MNLISTYPRHRVVPAIEQKYLGVKFNNSTGMYILTVQAKCPAYSRIETTGSLTLTQFQVNQVAVSCYHHVNKAQFLGDAEQR